MDIEVASGDFSRFGLNEDHVPDVFFISLLRSLKLIGNTYCRGIFIAIILSG